MANLVVRNIDDRIVKALKAKAGLEGISAEAEHRKILEQTLMRPKARSLAQVLAAMPEAGLDEDFARAGGGQEREIDVSD